MKQLMMVSLLLISTISYSQRLDRGCWNNGRHSESVSDGSPNGKIEVTVYETQQMDVIVENTVTYNLSSTGYAYFTVAQPIRTDHVYVLVRFFVRNADGTYTPQVLQNGEGTDRSYLSNSTQSVQCKALALVVLDMKAQRVDANTIKLQFTLDNSLPSTNVYKIKVSTDGKVFTDKTIVFPDGATPNKTYSLTIKL